MFPHLKGFNLQQWIDENRGNWGQRRVIWEIPTSSLSLPAVPTVAKIFTSTPAMRSSTNSKANSIFTTLEKMAKRSSLS